MIASRISEWYASSEHSIGLPSRRQAMALRASSVMGSLLVAFRGQGFGACRWVLCRRRVIHPKSFSVNAILCKVAVAAFRDSPATKDCGAFRDMPRVGTGETPYTQCHQFGAVIAFGYCKSISQTASRVERFTQLDKPPTRLAAFSPTLSTIDLQRAFVRVGRTCPYRKLGPKR